MAATPTRRPVAACAALKDGLSRIARERIGAEMRKLLAAADPGPAVALMDQTGVLPLLLPGADPARLSALLAAERAAASPSDWPRRLAALSAADPAEALRLSKAEARHQAALRRASAENWSLDEAAYRLGDSLATDLTLLRGLPPPQGWQARIARAAASPLPISAADLPQLQGPAVGRALRAAETAWIASGFAMPAPALIDAALLAAEETT